MKRKSWGGRICPATRKIQYANQATAERAASRSQIPCLVYACRSCKRFHLTTDRRALQP